MEDAMPGPAPKPAEQRRRRNAPVANTVKLPAAGREGDPPAWPLGGAQPSMWEDLWHTPQAEAWARLGWTRFVARYAQVLTWCESGEPSVGLLSEARQMEDRLGLTPMSMLRLRWEIASDEIAEMRAEKAAAPKATARRRLKVADGNVARA